LGAAGTMIKRLLLLPEMDGTGKLYADFITALPQSFDAEVVRYPVDLPLSYSDLMGFVQSTAKDSCQFVLVAESFSTPLAIQFAAMHSPNLKGLILCAGFVASPVRGLRRYLCLLLAPFIFRIKLTQFASKLLLAGFDAPAALLAAAQAAISSVRPEVLSARLRAVLDCDAREELSRVTVPILYLQARLDRLVPACCLDQIRRINPQISVEKIDGPHLLFQRKPKETANIVANCISQIS
jgi:pimeloyl-[acyl-carrier protein] methyl ester esterase